MRFWIIAGIFAWTGSETVTAHTNYGGTVRDLGTVVDASVSPYFKTINTVQTVTSDFGWAAGTDSAFGDAHHIRAYRFTLTDWSLASIRFEIAARGDGAQTFFPGFSLYSDSRAFDKLGWIATNVSGHEVLEFEIISFE